MFDVNATAIWARVLTFAAMRTLALVAVLALGCGGKKEERPAPSEPASAPAPVAGAVQLFVGDEAVGAADAARVADWPRLETLLPENARRLGKWESIATQGAKTSEITRPFETYRDYVPALFPGEGGSISFGLFDPVEYGKRGTPAVREDQITSLRVTIDADSLRGGNDHGSVEAIDPAKLELVIQTPAGDKTVTGTQLLGIDRVPMPGGGGDATGWTLDILLGAAGVTDFQKLRLFDAGGTSLPLEKAELADAVPFIKLNRQGALRFRLYKKQGQGYQSAGDLRSLVKVEIVE